MCKFLEKPQTGKAAEQAKNKIYSDSYSWGNYMPAFGFESKENTESVKTVAF